MDMKGVFLHGVNIRDVKRFLNQADLLFSASISDDIGFYFDGFRCYVGA